MKLTTHLHLVPRLRVVELFLHSLIRLCGIVLNNISKGKRQFFIAVRAFHNLVTKLSDFGNSILKEHCLLRNNAMSVEVPWRFEGTYCFHLQSRKSKVSKLCSYCLLFCRLFTCHTLRLWRWKECRMILWNVFEYLPDHTASHLRY
jgi:hypothetical protein